MAFKQLRARFFVDADGNIIEKARPLNYNQRIEIFNRDGWQCQSCSVPVILYGKYVSMFGDESPGAVDHIFPRSRGGQNDPDNLQLLCQKCNASKGARV